MKRKIAHLLKKTKRRTEQQKITEAAANAPRITNTSIATHREEVLSRARKYILPLQHSKHQIVIITTALSVLATVVFFAYTAFALYKLQATSLFTYRVTQVLPYPVAKVGDNYVAYENYLFELRRLVHYYQNQLKTDFKDPKNNDQLTELKHRALDKVINDAYVRQLATQHKLSVSDQEVNDEITVVRNLNRLGSNDKVFEDVLKDYWGWSVDDFRRSLRQELLAQKVVSKLDTAAHQKADQAFLELKQGVDFAAVAKKYSDDEATKNNGGDVGYAVDRTDRNLSSRVTSRLFTLRPGEFSDVIDTGTALEIIKYNDANGDKINASRIVISFSDVNGYLDELKEQQKSKTYIRL